MTSIYNQRTAIIVGATGLVGNALLIMLLSDISIKKVIVFSRRPLDLKDAKLEVVETDFDNYKPLAKYFQEADVLFCCIGTTIKVAGSKEAFRKVDFEIPVKLAELSSKNGIKSFIVISSLGADFDSRNFYLKTKGEMEQEVAKFKFVKLAFVRPSMLLGPRKEFRLGERIGQFAMTLFTPLLVGIFKKFRPIHETVVAKAMIQISNSASNQKIYESAELDWLG